MYFEIETIDEVSVVSISGRLDLEGVEEIEAEFQAAAKDTRRLVVDVRAVDYISSAGIRLVLGKLRSLQSAGGRLVLCGLQPLVANVFETTRLGEVIPIFATREEAIRSLRQASG